MRIGCKPAMLGWSSSAGQIRGFRKLDRDSQVLASKPFLNAIVNRNKLETKVCTVRQCPSSVNGLEPAQSSFRSRKSLRRQDRLLTSYTRTSGSDVYSVCALRCLRMQYTRLRFGYRLLRPAALALAQRFLAEAAIFFRAAAERRRRPRPPLIEAAALAGRPLRLLLPWSTAMASFKRSRSASSSAIMASVSNSV